MGATAAELASEARRRFGTYRAAGAAVGVPYATLYRMARGANVGHDAERRVRRALGIGRKPRAGRPRPYPSPEHEERRVALGATWGDVIEAGLRSLEAQQHVDGLLPCPWCGHAPVSMDTPIAQRYEGLPASWAVWCNNRSCPAAPEIMGATQAEAEARWNQRSQLPPQVGKRNE